VQSAKNIIFSDVNKIKNFNETFFPKMSSERVNIYARFEENLENFQSFEYFESIYSLNIQFMNTTNDNN
jgi:hypothetical protein